MITRDTAMAALANRPNFTIIADEEKYQTILNLYKEVDELEEKLAQAAHNQCGCLGGTISGYDR